MNGHGYRHAGSVATHVVRTEYGAFHLCPACVKARHAGIKYGNSYDRLPFEPAAASRPCDCEHVDHMSQEVQS